MSGKKSKDTVQPKKMGRPGITEAQKTELFERIAKGESITKICKDKHMMCEASVHNHLNEDKDFLERYARAKELCTLVYVDEIITIADRVKASHCEVESDKLRVDVRKWAAEKLNPKRFGNKVDLNHSGGMSISWHEEKTYEANEETNEGN